MFEKLGNLIELKLKELQTRIDINIMIRNDIWIKGYWAGCEDGYKKGYEDAEENYLIILEGEKK